jgi:hypothetical protein
MRNVLVLSVVAALGAPAIASADRCALNSRSVAERALTIVKQGSTVLEYCEPCGDKAPGKPFVVKSIENKDGRVLVNGSVRSLAYLFVKGGAEHYQNVGIMSRCGARDVSAWIIDGEPSGPHKVPPAPPPPPRPPITPLPRVSSPDELIGSWAVKITTRATTCNGIAKDVPASPPPRSEETWAIDSVGGAITILTTTGQELNGSVGSMKYGTYRHRLTSKQKPTELMLDLTHSVKHRFYGTIVKTELVASRGRSHCVTLLDVAGTQLPAP